MKKIEINMVRRDTAKVELDEDYFNEEWFEGFRAWLYDYDTLEEVAEYITYNVIHNKQTEIDGIGIPLRDGERPYWIDKDVEVNEHVNISFNPYDTETDYE
ncbi:hypothetical protein [Enterococcus sp. AZ163]|uniref:hypothetical protein n=1 Tax=Enterococcus sp. AZ163 TaxID=2774638 RepID=UPI003D2E60FD